jgi:general secretion pathway protein A
VNVQYRMRPFTKDETSRYIDIQMKQAGGPEDTFDESVKALIHDFSGGIPRQINNIATACLVQAAGTNVIRIDEKLFQHTTVEFQLS